ncbi:FadR family transcriptional regulator [Lactonifactor longoviformis]|uniref:DNA-binding transcriptional regulator, FadR family n=1 Tax=Lactonifactor longoviformis DSM 17459 TaxID=1122155 RepID=A0A1M4YZQ8_9CLOT|nr:FCD domain-containing protein [Lactonifactor longoviformis]POP33877.1 FadR family transcriptional regulator [Lactonifactor longoviformis]SHF11313.1 DNA-binding transcriptional regulator, FadR family [Lactonifactor longoviformis DSM 17459]
MSAKTKDLKIRKMSAPDLVCKEMKALISQGIWEENKKIPSEGELAETFGVNRFTVRMALQKLNTLGVLDTRMGDGTYVCSFDFDKHMQNISEFYMTPDLLNDVAEFRAIIEVECARLAILRATEEDLLQLKRCCEVFEKDITAYVNAPRGSRNRELFYEKFNDSDIEIHTQLCKMSHNDLLIYAFSTAKEAIREHMYTIGHQRVIHLEPGEDIGSVKNHWEIYHAIEKKDFDMCRSLLIDMIDYNNPTE